MPNNNEKKKQKVNVAPSFASQLNTETANMAAERPDTLPLAYGEMGPLSSLIFNKLSPAHAITSPWGTIYYNKKMIEEDKVPVKDVVRHEMTHVGQGPWNNIKSWFSSSTRDKMEEEARGVENTRRRTKDINLTPSFARKK